MSANTIDVLIRFPKNTADALKAERRRTGCSTSEFIRRAVNHALNPTGIEIFLRDAEENEERRIAELDASKAERP